MHCVIEKLKECGGLKTTSINSICVLLVISTSFLARPNLHYTSLTMEVCETKNRITKACIFC